MGQIKRSFGDNMNTKDLKSKLLKQYKYRIELHAHTSPASGCSEITPKEMVDTYKSLGYDAVTITNHFIHQYHGPEKAENVDIIIRDYEETKKYGDEVGLKVYLGAEVRFTESCNDYLLFGVNKEMLLEIYDLLPFGLENFRKNYSMPDSVFLQAHPMRDGMQRVDPALLDGIEVFNLHPHHNSKVGMAAVYAKENNLEIMVAGSDFHHPNLGHEGVAALRADSLPEDSFQLAALLKKGDYLLEAGRNNIIIP